MPRLWQAWLVPWRVPWLETAPAPGMATAGLRQKTLFSCFSFQDFSQLSVRFPGRRRSTWFAGRCAPDLKSMDRILHELAERLVDHAVARDGRLAGECR